MAQARGSQSGPVDQQRENAGRPGDGEPDAGDGSPRRGYGPSLQSTGYRAMTMEAVADPRRHQPGCPLPPLRQPGRPRDCRPPPSPAAAV